MKAKTLIAVGLLVMVFSRPSWAGSATEELVDRLYSEREAVLDSVVQGWLGGGDPEELASQIYRLVDVQIRLQGNDPSAMRDFAGKVISEAGLSAVDSKEQLAAAVGLAYYHQKGLRVNTR